MAWLLVFVGGGLGSIARYGLAQLLPAADFSRGELPWFTLAANVLACLALGIGLAMVSRELLSRPLQLLLLTGFCGGFSTFSTFVMEVFLLGEEGQLGAACWYLLLSLAGGMGALYLALLVGR